MKESTRRKFNEMWDDEITRNGAVPNDDSINLTLDEQQKRENAIREESQLLSLIFNVGVDDAEGLTVPAGSTGPLSKRTDIDHRDRSPHNAKVAQAVYRCASTEYDRFFDYATMDALAPRDDFAPHLQAQILKQQALDRVITGFNGIEAATQTDIESNPLLQDVNIGWLQQYRNNAAEAVATGSTTIGSAGDYENLDALVSAKINALMDQQYRQHPGLAVFVSRDLLAGLGATEQPTSQKETDAIFLGRRIAGLRALTVPAMPNGTLFVNPPDNLGFYWKRGSRWSYRLDEPRLNRVALYETSEDAYVIQDYARGCLIENVSYNH